VYTYLRNLQLLSGIGDIEGVSLSVWLSVCLSVSVRVRLNVIFLRYLFLIMVVFFVK
jgi:hypothetical protein